GDAARLCWTFPPFHRRSLPVTLARTQITGSGLILARRPLTNTPLGRGRLPRGPAAAIAMARQLAGRVLSRARGTGLPRSLGPLQAWPGREADPLGVSCPRSCRGACWSLSCGLAWLSCAGLVAQLASRLSASCEGEPGSVV